MRILMLTPQLPYPPRQGTAMRNWGLLSHLAHRHEIWLLSFDENDTSAPAPEVRNACREVAVFPVPQRSTPDRLRQLLTSKLPDMAWRLWSRDFAAQLQHWLALTQFDIIQVEGIELARYALQPAVAALHPHTRIVFDDHNCEYLLQRRASETDARQPRRWHAAAYSAVQWRRLASFERHMSMASDATVCVSPLDAAAVGRLDPSIRPQVVYNGIDLALYRDWNTPPPNTPNPGLVFTGKMDFRPNIDAMLWFGREVFPQVKQELPQARLWIVGQRPSPRLDVLRADPNITLTGEVEDVRPYIAQAGVYVAPLRVGGGTRFKLLEAMAMHRPIVSTSLGCEGFNVQPGQELLIGDSPADFAAAVVRLARDAALCADIVRRAYDFVSAHYDWSAIVPKLELVYSNLLNHGKD